MDDCVYITRQFTGAKEYLCIYGVYRTEDDAKRDLLNNHPSLEFDEILWRWEDKFNKCFYRIDAYSVR